LFTLDSPHPGKKLSRRQNLDAKRLLQDKQILVPGDDRLRAAGEGAGEEWIIPWIAAALLADGNWLITFAFCSIHFSQGSGFTSGVLLATRRAISAYSLKTGTVIAR
jgi:hypothetical protein